MNDSFPEYLYLLLEGPGTGSMSETADRGRCGCLDGHALLGPGTHGSILAATAAAADKLPPSAAVVFVTKAMLPRSAEVAC